MDSTKRLLFFIGTGLVGLLVIAVWLAAGGAGDATGDQPRGADGANVGATSLPDDSDDADPGAAVEADEAADPDDSAGDADTVGEFSSEACNQFEGGSTVADFAEWFEEHSEGTEEERAELFRAVITRALTEECPEVIPDG